MPSFANAVIKNTQKNYLKKAAKGNPGIKSAAEIQQIVDKQLASLPALAKNVTTSIMTPKPIITDSPNFV